MPRFGYSAEVEEPHAKALGREMRISPKHAMEICRAIRGMHLAAAEEFLREVVGKRRPVPVKRHSKTLPHRRGASGAGRYPVKAARAIMEVLGNVKANAKYKGLDMEKLVIAHASAQKGITIPGFMPRAFARATPFNRPTTNVEIIVKEVE